MLMSHGQCAPSPGDAVLVPSYLCSHLFIPSASQVFPAPAAHWVLAPNADPTTWGFGRWIAVLAEIARILGEPQCNRT